MAVRTGDEEASRVGGRDPSLSRTKARPSIDSLAMMSALEKVDSASWEAVATVAPRKKAMAREVEWM